MDPFCYGRVVQNTEFCPRPPLAKSLKQHIDRKQNVALIGERRMGKTSLIISVTSDIPAGHAVYVDLLEIKTIDDFVDRVAQALVLYRSRQGLLITALDTLKALKPSISLDPITGMPTVSIDARWSKSPSTLEALLDVIGDFSSKDGLVVVLDEFQDILNLKNAPQLIAVLRSKIQFQTKTTYIYSGSVRNEMEKLFVDPESPLFKSTARIYVGPLDRTVFGNYLKKKFSKTNRKIDKQALESIFEAAQDIPGDIQELCSALWSISNEGDIIGLEHMPNALKLIFSRELKAYENTMCMISAQQSRVLATLARLGGKKPTSKNFIEHTGIHLPGSIKRALDGLMKKKVVLRRGKGYYFVNPFFAAWLRHKQYF